MRRRTAISLAACLALSGCLATPAGLLRLDGTAPRYLRSGTCEAPVYSPYAGPLTIHFRSQGREDSLFAYAGEPFRYVKKVPRGTYTVQCWVTRPGSPYPSCDTTVTGGAR
jgi:hypothetical protein